MIWTIRRTLLALGIAGTALVVLVGAVSALSLSRQDSAGAAIVVTLQALRNHLEGDMMHDGLRADVLDALYAAEWEPARRTEVEQGLAEHAAWFREALRKNSELELSRTVKQALAEARPALESYIASAEQLVTTAFGEVAKGRSMLPDFQRAFDDLETKNEALSDAIQADVAATNKAASEIGGLARTVSWSLTLLAAGILLATTLLVSRRIVRAMAELLRVARAMGSGDLSARVALEGKNELADAGRAINEAIDGVSFALGAERVDWQMVGRDRQDLVRIRQLVENAPINLFCADRDLRVSYLNPAARRTLSALQQHLPVQGNELLGSPIEALHPQPERQRELLRDPGRLPHRSRVRVGPEHIDVDVAAVLDSRGDYLGPMVTWNVVTERVESERRLAEAQRREEQQREERRRYEQEKLQREQEASAQREAEQRVATERERERAAKLRGSVDEILAVVSAAAGGDLTQRIELDDDGAVGKLARGLTEFFERLRANIADIAVTAANVAGASTQMTRLSETLERASGQTSTEASSVSTASGEVTQTATEVAMSMEQMAQSIREIARNASDGARVAETAVRAAERTTTTIGKLGQSSAEIQKVIKLITTIAEQTNLLALNATIEAARAGESGKGFAVVANEVKDLAKATAGATAEIEHQITAIRTDTEQAVAAIGEINGVIAQIHEFQASIASAVEQQTATTNEIERHVAKVASRSREISDRVASVAGAAKDASAGSSETQTAAADLAEIAARLQTLVSQFDIGTTRGGASRAELELAAT